MDARSLSALRGPRSPLRPSRLAKPGSRSDTGPRACAPGDGASQGLFPVRFHWFVFACVLLAVALRLPYVTVPLGVDEGGIAYIAQAWPGGQGSLYGAYWLDRPPLLVVLFKVAVLAGDTGIRALGAVAAALIVVGVASIGRLVAGAKAGQAAALVAALMSASVALSAVYTAGELLAAVPATFSVLCLVLAHRRGHARWLVAAGALAVGAVLVKQSALDAGVAGVIFLVASAARDRGVSLRRPLAYAAGCAAALVVPVAWLVVTGTSPGEAIYALFGFRLDALRALRDSALPLQSRVGHLAVPALTSGLAAALVAAMIGLRHLRADRVLMATLAGWLVGASIGVLGGGSYWRHYLIQLVPVCSVATGVALANAGPRVRRSVLRAATVIAVATALGATYYLHLKPQRQPEVAVARYVRTHAKPGDTQYVMYARANVAYYIGLPTPFPYSWSLMIRAIPGARARLRRTLISDARPTWLIAWQDDDIWELDQDEAMDRILSRRYRQVATVAGHPIYHRNDQPARIRTRASR